MISTRFRFFYKTSIDEIVESTNKQNSRPLVQWPAGGYFCLRPFKVNACNNFMIWILHRSKSYTISDFANYYDETNGYYWTGPDNFSCSDAISLASLNEAQTIEKIRSYVKNHIPVACHAVGSGSRQHWFVAYELTGESGGTWATAGIKVLDPYNRNSGSTEGRRVTILEAMQTSHVTLGVDRIRIPN